MACRKLTYTKKTTQLKLVKGGFFSNKKGGAGAYRFGGAGGQEKDDEIFIGAYTAEYWEYDSRLGRRWNVDPLTNEFPWQSPYTAFDNNPIYLIDPTGESAGDYYDKEGQHLGSDGKDDNKAYVADNVTKNEQGVVTGATNSNELKITHSELQKQAATVYGESSAFKTKGMTDELKKEMFAIASVHQRNKIAYGANSDQAKLYTNTGIDSRNGTKMQLANAAVINAVTGGFDYSYGATNWDGIEQAAFKASDTRYSNGRFEIHKNTIGWRIGDEHYTKWKSYATSNGYAFNAPKVSTTVGGVYHRGRRNIPIQGGRVGFTSTAVYGGTIFWKK